MPVFWRFLPGDLNEKFSIILSGREREYLYIPKSNMKMKRVSLRSIYLPPFCEISNKKLKKSLASLEISRILLLTSFLVYNVSYGSSGTFFDFKHAQRALGGFCSTSSIVYVRMLRKLSLQSNWLRALSVLPRERGCFNAFSLLPTLEGYLLQKNNEINCWLLFDLTVVTCKPELAETKNGTDLLLSSERDFIVGYEWQNIFAKLRSPLPSYKAALLVL